MGRYYEDYHSRRFPNQQLLCESIDRANNGCLLQTDEANPLTIRLLVSEEAVNYLQELINHESDTKILSLITVLNTELESDPFSYGLNWETNLVYFSSGSGIASPTPCITDPNNFFRTRHLPPIFRRESSQLRFVNEEDYAFPLAMAHIAVYNYFSNYGSILDRFSNEINRLYSLGIRDLQIDWGKIIQNVNILGAKDTQLASAISTYHSSDSEILMKYRNRLIHDGLIPLRAEVTRMNRWVVYAPDYPNNPSNLTKDVLVLCRNTQNALVQFLNNCYGLILSQLRSFGQPPW
jgi:hypothetical protein